MVMDVATQERVMVSGVPCGGSLALAKVRADENAAISGRQRLVSMAPRWRPCVWVRAVAEADYCDIVLIAWIARAILRVVWLHSSQLGHCSIWRGIDANPLFRPFRLLRLC